MAGRYELILKHFDENNGIIDDNVFWNIQTTLNLEKYVQKEKMECGSYVMEALINDALE